MPSYRVTWEIDEVEAETPEDAAAQARRLIADPRSIAHSFAVRDMEAGDVKTIDLDLTSDGADGAHLNLRHLTNEELDMHIHAAQRSRDPRGARDWLRALFAEYERPERERVPAAS